MVKLSKQLAGHPTKPARVLVLTSGIRYISDIRYTCMIQYRCPVRRPFFVVFIGVAVLHGRAGAGHAHSQDQGTERSHATHHTGPSHLKEEPTTTRQT